MVAELVSIPVNFYLSLYISAKLLSPLAPLFDKSKAFAKVDFIGMKAKVHSSEVNSQRGEIIVHHNGSEFYWMHGFWSLMRPLNMGTML